MKNKEIIVTISSKAGRGKSRLTFLLKSFLREQGFEVEFGGDEDSVNENEFDNRMEECFEGALDQIKSETKIILKQQQLAL